jgi:chromosome partitioning protein
MRPRIFALWRVSDRLRAAGGNLFSVGFAVVDPPLEGAENNYMAIRVCIGNRQGGVGKSTVTMMLAHSLACFEKKRVLVIDLDTQCNSSFAMIGSARVLQAIKDKATLSDYMAKRMHGRAVLPTAYAIINVGDVASSGPNTNIDLIPSSIDLDEEIQEAIISTKLADPFNSMNFLVRELLERLDEGYDYILMDCPPGLSPMVNAAVHLAHKAVLPFRPDYISQYALDRMANKVENIGRGARAKSKLASIPFEMRRYVSVVNLYGGTTREDRILEEYEGLHPRLPTPIRREPAVAEAFYWQEDFRSVSEKYGKAARQVKCLYDELAEWLQSRIK